ncbi:MAG: RidA family protein [Elusimicrobiales bacterium]|nr:RidA family protein [Elusimicrobiales bacterium]
MKNIIITENAPAAIGPYSQATEANGFIFISGQLPINAKTGAMAPADVKAQTEASLKNIEAILAKAGLTMDNVMKTTVLMTDLSKFGEMNETYAKFFNKAAPARAAYEVKALPKGAMVEIEAIAVRF